MKNTPEKKSKPVDLSTLDVSAIAEQGAILNVTHPVSGQNLGVSIRLAGADSEIYRKAMRAAAARRINSRRRSALTPEEMEQEALELLAKATLGWEGVVLDGETLPFSPENARRLYGRFPWIKEQVDLFIVDRGNFLQD